jgi:hypothetical protein
MPTWMKVLLIVGGLLVVLLVAAGVATFFVVRRYGPALVEAGKQTMAEGTEYGRRTDNEGCLNEAVARQARIKGIAEVVKNGIFMRSCLEASRPTPGFCDDVPGRMEFMRAARWQLDQCKRHGLTQEQQCGQLFQQVQQFCEMRGLREHVNVNANEGRGDEDGIAPPTPPTPPAPAR